MIVKGPGIAAGSTFTANVIKYDFLPTFVDWAGGEPESLKDIDGVSLAGYETAIPGKWQLNRFYDPMVLADPLENPRGNQTEHWRIRLVAFENESLSANVEPK